MKFSILLLVLCALTGCAQHQGNLPPVSGDPQPVNSPAMIQELTHHV
ncbi:hypothetical protein WJF72_003324 [Klebsiella aerogenes]|nr:MULTISPECIES: hypothetical protein [Yersiniaceae]EKT9638820.1 hypothetical protein [Pluralibacter gergoviae]ELA0066938.1 hypothetical protein [Klebsiella aerogenes]HBS7606522.1 hypothetical protein [Klebsiella pneumoniae]HDT4905102.1 hypothetical protein [Enterobacter ludwigii]EMD1656755.1 hypothetical protein [Pluralibacter gergoviae]